MQAWDEVLDPFLDTVEYEGEIVRRWWPLGKDVAVLVDPNFGFGLPVVEGTGVRTEIIAERHRAGDSIDEITYDFDVTPKQITDALRWRCLSGRVIFIDASLPKTVADELKKVREDVVSKHEIFRPGTDDPIWLRRVGIEGWLAITRDWHIRTRPGNAQR
jgi:uncharacterized protein (DUF433 family)